jgi:hypothetical protein
MTRSTDVMSLADEPRVQELIRSSILNLWAVVNNLTRLRPTRTCRMSRRTRQ